MKRPPPSGRFDERSVRRSPARWRLALALLLLLPGAAALAQGISVSVDRPEATVRDQLVLRVTVEGSRGARPVLPELPDFAVYPQEQRTQTEIVGGRASFSVAFNYVLVPRRAGTFTIGEATVEIDGETYRSRPFEVRIVEADATPTQSRDLFVTTAASPEDPYVGQEVIYTWRFYRRVQVADARLESWSFDGFLAEDLGEVREYETTVNGVRYLVSEIRKALFPQEEGEQVIPASHLSCQVMVTRGRRSGSLFDQVFGRAEVEPKVLAGPEITLQVRPLPPAPSGFSGLVGEFGVRGEISKRELRVGESATWELTVSGTGNAQLIGEPKLPELTAFKVYDDKPDGGLNRSGRSLSGRRTFRKAIVPLSAGEKTLPPVELVYFDPAEERYRTARTEAVALAVAPADGEEELNLTESLAPTGGRVSVRILADDILPLHKGLGPVTPLVGPGREAPLLLAGLLAPPLGFAVALIAQRRRERFARDSGLRRRREALRKARRRLREMASSGGGEDPGAQASLCLREYVGDMLGVEGAALTAAEVAESLRSAGVSDEIVDSTRRLLEGFEAAQYGSAKVSAEGLVDELRQSIESLDEALRGRR